MLKQPRTSANEPAILANEQQQSYDVLNEEDPKSSKESLFHLIGHVKNGVSVRYYLRTILLQEVRDAGLDEDTATI